MFKLFRKKPIQLQIVRRDESKLRLVEWQADPRMCGLAAKVLASADLQLMLSVLRNEHPSKIALHYGVGIDVRALMQARAEGYEMALTNLEALAINTTPVPMPEATFEAV